ncbi:pilus assembly protein PilM [Vibrio sp. SM6]|uniref:Pilus assembly protein PilM n=1 Tax=Vibrio agarilyticus TaxID=2726741 RepID=A0A7X8TRJ7_9VIBR|nr:pilus assembly protein PilM [Vibrio agarilyticus]NLS13484.1 pilus assembly protein PilM [Vibrio agarilyticus]
MVAPLVTGIDISSHSLRAVTLRHHRAGFTLLGCHEIEPETAIVTENHLVNHQEIVNLFNRLKNKLPIFRRKVALAIPEATVIRKILHIERHLEGREREFALEEAFALQSPLPIESLSIDYVALNSALDDATVRYQVVATRRDVVESRWQALKAAKLTPVRFDVHTHALMQLWRRASYCYPAQTHFGLLHIEAAVAHLLIEHNPVSSDSLALAERAPFHKAIAGSWDNQQQGANLVEKVQLQWQLYRSMHSQTLLRGLWITGIGADDVELRNALSRALDIECVMLNPLALVDGEAAVKRSVVHPERCGVALGLAIGGLEWLEGHHAP